MRPKAIPRARARQSEHLCHIADGDATPPAESWCKIPRRRYMPPSVVVNMSRTTSPPILVLHHNVDRTFLDHFIGLLRVLFPTSVVHAQDLSWLGERAPIDGSGVALAQPGPIVLVGPVHDWLDALRTHPSLKDAVGVHLGPANPLVSEAEVEWFPAADVSKLEELFGTLAQRTQLDRPLGIAAHRKAFSELADMASALGRTRSETFRRWRTHVGAIVGVGLIGALGWMLMSHTSEANPPERFGFEDGITPWQPQTANDSRGCVAVKQSDERPKAGRHSLEATFELDAADRSRSSGEVWAPLVTNAPADAGASDDLFGRTVVAWVYCTESASGRSGQRNGFQLYVKDSKWRSQYGAWVPAEPGEWLRLAVTVGDNGAEQHVDPGFDGHAVSVVGIKLAVAANSNTKSMGTVFVDSVGW